jgi:hypothetical protein
MVVVPSPKMVRFFHSRYIILILTVILYHRNSLEAYNASTRKLVLVCKVEGWGWAIVPIPKKGMPSLFIMCINTNLLSYRRMHTEHETQSPMIGVHLCPLRATAHHPSLSKREMAGSHCQHPASILIFEWRRAFHDHTTPLA